MFAYSLFSESTLPLFFGVLLSSAHALGVCSSHGIGHFCIFAEVIPRGGTSALKLSFVSFLPPAIEIAGISWSDIRDRRLSAAVGGGFGLNLFLLAADRACAGVFTFVSHLFPKSLGRGAIENVFNHIWQNSYYRIDRFGLPNRLSQWLSGAQFSWRVCGREPVGYQSFCALSTGIQ